MRLNGCCARLWAAGVRRGARRSRPPTLGIDVLSNRADVISAGDALVEVEDSAGVARRRSACPTTAATSRAPSPCGRTAASRARHRPALGPNVLTASAPGATSASITITNHPNGGPVFSGPQVQPWVCQSTARRRAVQPAGDLRVPVQVDDHRPVRRPTTRHSPPSDVATTTTDQGKTVPFIVRIETGYQDRDQYKIAVLYQPGKPWTAWTPQPQFNHKLLITHGASCGIDHQTGDARRTSIDRRRGARRAASR